MTGKRTLTVGLVGYEFMGKAHSNAWRQAPRFLDLSTHVRLRAICGCDAKTVREVAMQRRDALRFVLGELGRHGGDPSSQLSKMVSKINVC
jgi:predicted dehydrogenase